MSNMNYPEDAPTWPVLQVREVRAASAAEAAEISTEEIHAFRKADSGEAGHTAGGRVLGVQSRPGPELLVGSEIIWAVTWDGVVILEGFLDEPYDADEAQVREDLAEAGVEEADDQSRVLALLKESIAGQMPEDA